VTRPFSINLVANLIFTPIQFGLRNLTLAAADILVVWTTILWCMVAIWPHYRWAAVTQVPYFVWVSLATVLQLSITAMIGELNYLCLFRLAALPQPCQSLTWLN
jgi:benzodiazapine receptor